jgi:hypothetical protein
MAIYKQNYGIEKQVKKYLPEFFLAFICLQNKQNELI